MDSKNEFRIVGDVVWIKLTQGKELQDWRQGCEAAFGIITANPRKTLLEVSRQLKNTKNQYEVAIEELKMIKETIDCSLECLAYKEK